MACPPHHINSLSFCSNGWISAQNSARSGRQEEEEEDVIRSIEITPSCKRLLEELKVDLSCDIFNGNNHSKSSGADNEAGSPLEELLHLPSLPNTILKVIADVRRLGAPSERDLGRREKKEGGQGNRRNNRSGGRTGKVAQLEEQRRLRKQQEQQKIKQTQQNNQTEQDKEKTVAHVEEVDVHGIPNDEEDFGLIGDNNDLDPEEVMDTELRLAAVFNTIRILITLIRPMLDHPQRKDLKLKMKKGPSLKKEGKGKRFYLMSKHVYSCVSIGGWNEISREFTKLLNEMKWGLSEAMSKLNSDGQYELNAKDWVISLFNLEFYTNQELVAEKCMGLSTSNSEIASKVHDALMNRFKHDHDEMKCMLQRSIDKLQDKLMSAISRRYNGVRLTVYGSCLSGLALEGSHDVDVSVFIPELDTLKKNFDAAKITAAEYEKKMRRIIFQVRDSLHNARSFSGLFAVTRARVPVVKGKDIYAQNPYTQDRSLSFDLCFLNDIAVVNSSLLREYSLFDSRVRILMLSVKSFAKKNDIASAANGTLSSYSWLNMVVFYLQCIGLIPVLQCPKLMAEHDFEVETGNHWHSINGLKTFFLTKDLVTKKDIWKCPSKAHDTNVAMLLYGFFNFYSNIFPQQTVAASIRFGNCVLQKTSFQKSSKLWRLCMEDPFETYDSHCPHDLGCHVKEDGQRCINEHLMRATNELAALMQQQTLSDASISQFICQLLGPMPKSNNGKVERGSASVAQSKHHPRQDAHHQVTRRGPVHHEHRHVNAKGSHNKTHQQNQNNGRIAREIKQRNDDGVSTYAPAKSQMKGDNRDKNDSYHAQQRNGRKGKSTKKDDVNTDANSTQPNKQSPQAGNPNHDKFIKKQKERLRKISKVKNSQAHSNKNKQRGSNGNDAVEEKLNKPLDAKRNQTDGTHNQKGNSSKLNDRKIEN